MVLITSEILYSITSEMYEAATAADADAWQYVYSRISDLVGSGPGSIQFRRAADDRFTPLADTNVPEFVDDFNSLYFHILPFRDDMLALRTGEELTRTRDYPDELYLASELYNDHFRRLGLYEIFHYCLLEDEAVTAGITFSRPERAGAFGKEERDAVIALVPHLQRAVNMHVTVARAAHRDRVNREALDMLPQPVLLMTPRRRTAFHNLAARTMLKKDNGVWLDGAGRLRCAAPADCEAIDALIDSVFETGGGNGFGGRAFVRRPGRKPLAVSIFPFTEGTASPIGIEKLAFVTITDPEAATGPSPEEMRTIFGLTKSESRLAKLIADGSSLPEICEAMEITVNTARTHLKRIFAKTDTSRQTELLKLLSGFPPHHRNGDKS
jgi:DNA-binding CsgD family transcriptional regulator/PAS domain-containing protein